MKVGLITTSSIAGTPEGGDPDRFVGMAEAGNTFVDRGIIDRLEGVGMGRVPE